MGIAGHIEWFDLINETVQAFLIVPLYALFNKCIQDKKKFRERIFESFLVVNVIYILFAVITLIYCHDIVATMVPGRIREVTGYLRLETIGFVIANVVSFVNVLLVVLEFLIPKFGVNGVAYSNIAVNSVCVILCLFVIMKEQLMAVSFKSGKEFVKDYLFMGLFSGSQVLLDNVVYSAIVCKMVNAVEEQGNYWTANNIIWGLIIWRR